MADLGVPMRAGATNAGPEDAFGMGAKHGDYSARIGYADYSPHEGAVAQRLLAQGNIALIAPDVALGDDLTTDVYTIEAAGDVVGVVYVAAADITGADTNNRKLSLINGGANGEGTTEVAAITFGSGTDATAGDETTVALHGTAGNHAVAAGDKLKWKSAKVGTGIADPGGTVFVAVEYD